MSNEVQDNNQGSNTRSPIPYILLGGLVIGVIYMVATGQGALVGNIALAIGLLLLGITILVTIHELGHFLPAKLFGMRVEEFSIGFPPRVYGIKKGETEYKIGATPLGGYVKISGMIDESLDTDYLESEPQDWEFRSKPVWQRLIVMVGGVTMNVILGVFIFSMIMYAYGEVKTPMAQVNEMGIEVQEGTIGHALGLQTGDKILGFGGKPIEYMEEATPLLMLEEEKTFEVERNNQTLEIETKPELLGVDTLAGSLFFPDITPVRIDVDQDETRPAKKAGLQRGDIVLAVDSVPISHFSKFRAQLQNRANETLQLDIFRDGKPMTFSVTMDSASKMGVGPDFSALTQDTIQYNLLESFPIGTKKAFDVLAVNNKAFKQMGKGKMSASKSVMGPVQISKVFLGAFLAGGWKSFFVLTASLSMILAFVNILPIPALDGGHVVFLLYEGVSGRRPSTKVVETAQKIGIIFLLGLMILILFNDVFRLIF